MKNYIHHFVTDRGWNISQLKSLKENSISILPHNHLGELENDCQNKVAIVTGPSSGIGRAIAIELANKKTKVVLASRNVNKLHKLRDEIIGNGGLAVSFPTDVTNEKQCRSLIESTIKTFGKIDILVNNAGISMRANFKDVELSVLKKVMETNFWGTVYCTKYALPYILKQKGSIVGISSICGVTPLPGRTGYSASKHAMDGFLESLRIENIENDLHVLLVHPGFTTSNIRNVALNGCGVPQLETPFNEDKLMPAEKVAKEVVIGIAKKKKDITLTTEGRLITWIYKRMPNMAGHLIYHEMKKERSISVPE